MITDSRIILVGVFALAIIAAVQGKWEISGLAISGGFALLKGANHETPVDTKPAV